MGKWNISKSLDFCYGHRTYTQKLNGEFSSDLKQACRHLHGHEGKIVIHMEGETLDNTGMLTDFRHTEWCKSLINQYIDHQFIIDINDPMFGTLVLDVYNNMPFSPTVSSKEQFLNERCIPIVVPNTNHIIGHKINLDFYNDPDGACAPSYEVLEGYTIVDFVPTSENLSKWAATFIQAKMSRLGVKISHLEWWETPKSCSVYEA